MRLLDVLEVATSVEVLAPAYNKQGEKYEGKLLNLGKVIGRDEAYEKFRNVHVLTLCADENQLCVIIDI